MGSIRYETAYASAYLVEELRYSGRLARMLHNGIDIVLFETPSGEAVSVHFIDSGLPLYEIRNTLTDNAAQNRFTLFVLWADMMLPRHGERYVADDWMEALYTLYHDTIYAYEIIDGEPYIFPVYFRGTGLQREIEFGTAAHFQYLTCRSVFTYLAGLQGEWRVADFGGARGTAHDPHREAEQMTELQGYYLLLGVDLGDSRETIKKAYRLLARRLHPDLNSDQDAHEQMQRLNHAYNRLMESLGD
jgi:hypothetical protein